jgi:hypothetical protein
VTCCPLALALAFLFLFDTEGPYALCPAYLFSFTCLLGVDRGLFILLNYRLAPRAARSALFAPIFSALCYMTAINASRKHRWLLQGIIKVEGMAGRYSPGALANLELSGID